MRKCKIDNALDALNAARGLAYPAIGYSYYADIRGDGARRRLPRSIYTIISTGGGVTYSELNGATPRDTLCNIANFLGAAQ